MWHACNKSDLYKGCTWEVIRFNLTTPMVFVFYEYPGFLFIYSFHYYNHYSTSCKCRKVNFYPCITSCKLNWYIYLWNTCYFFRTLVQYFQPYIWTREHLIRALLLHLHVRASIRIHTLLYIQVCVRIGYLRWWNIKTVM